MSSDERILDAATALYLEHGIRRTSMEDIARVAGVGRATLYRKFGSREELTTAVTARESQRFFDSIAQATEYLSDVGERLIEGLVVGLRTIREHPLLHTLLHTEPELMLPAMTLNAGPGIAVVTQFLAAQYREAGAQVPQHIHVEELAEILVRLALSLVLTPETTLPLRTDEQVRATARRYLGMLLTSGEQG